MILQQIDTLTPLNTSEFFLSLSSEREEGDDRCGGCHSARGRKLAVETSGSATPWPVTTLLHLLMLLVGLAEYREATLAWLRLLRRLRLALRLHDLMSRPLHLDAIFTTLWQVRVFVFRVSQVREPVLKVALLVLSSTRDTTAVIDLSCDIGIGEVDLSDTFMHLKFLIDNIVVGEDLGLSTGHWSRNSHGGGSKGWSHILS